LEMGANLLAVVGRQVADRLVDVLGQERLWSPLALRPEAPLELLRNPLGASEQQERCAAGRTDSFQWVRAHLGRDVERRARTRAELVELGLRGAARRDYFLPSCGRRFCHCSSAQARVSFAASIDCRG